MSAGSAPSSVESSVTKGVASLSSTLNLAAGPTALAGFVAEGIFKAVKLGSALRKAQAVANASLDDAVRAEDVVRMPVAVNLDMMELQSFYENDAALAPFDAFTQFAPELDEYRRTGGNPSARTRRILQIAMKLVPALQDDPDLADHPELADLFSLSMDPSRQTVREAVLAYQDLFPEGTLSYQAHYDRLNGFWKNQLVISLGDIDQAQLDAQTELHETIRGLVRNAIFDTSAGLMTSTVDLAKKLKTDSIDARIDTLTDAKKAAREGEKAAIQAEIDALNKWKTRLG